MKREIHLMALAGCLNAPPRGEDRLEPGWKVNNTTDWRSPYIWEKK